MSAVHRNGDSRKCGAVTVSSQSRNVFVNGKLWAIQGDQNSHGAGSLIEGTNNIYIGGIPVINLGDNASPDSLCGAPGQPPTHCSPSATSGSSNVFCGD